MTKLNQKLIASAIDLALKLESAKGALYGATLKLAHAGGTVEGFKAHADAAREGIEARGGNPGSFKQYCLWIKDEMSAKGGSLDNVKTSGDAQKRYKERHPGKKGAQTTDGAKGGTVAEAAKVDGGSAVELAKLISAIEAMHALDAEYTAAWIGATVTEAEGLVKELKGKAEVPAKQRKAA